MKKILSLVLVAMLILSTGICSALADGSFKVGIAFANQQNVRFAFDEAFMREVIEAAGGEFEARYEKAAAFLLSKFDSGA